MKLWRRAAITFSVAWVAVLGIYIGISAYHEFACTPTVHSLPDGTIIREACVHSPVSSRIVLYTAAYFGGGVAVIWLLSWLFLGWPSDVVSGYFGYRRDRDGRDRL